jgi:transposase InsO family protein
VTPNAVWTIDFKGDFRVGAGYRCYPLTLRDAASRFTLRIDAFAAPDGEATQERLRRAFVEYGLPACLRSDNGPPFAGQGLAGLSQLNVWCLKLGIAIEHIAPGRPDQNGSHEQFHGILKTYTTRPPAHTLRGQQRRFDRFRDEYNYERPHQALGDTVPARHYQPSARVWPGRVPSVDYPGHWEARRVQLNGRITFARSSIFLSRALAGEWVALEEAADDTWTIHFSTVPLARWLARTQQLRPLRQAGPA